MSDEIQQLYKRTEFFGQFELFKQKQCPQQNNACDYGIYVIKYMDDPSTIDEKVWHLNLSANTFSFTECTNC